MMVTPFLLVMMLAQEQTQPPPLAGIVCTKPEPRGPSLMLPDGKGKCPKNTRAMGEKDGKAKYCVNQNHPAPVNCKTVKSALPNP